MSLRDTIEGARREAEGNVIGRPKKEAEAMGAGEEEKKGFSRSSAAKAKPAREAASSVRIASKPKVNDPLREETKDEKRERKRREREEQDLRNRAYDLVLRGMPEYRRSEKVFWVVVGLGMAFAIASLAIAYIFGEQTDLSTPVGIASVATLVAAYVCIIGAFIYDLVRRRPYRKRAEIETRGLTDKKLMELLERDRAEQLEKRARKESKRGK